MQDQKAQPQIDYTGARKIPANFCNLRHTNEEFIIDVGMAGVDPNTTKSEIDSSIVISPFMAKRLWMSLGTIVGNYEQTFGEIETESENRMVAHKPIPLAGYDSHIPMAPKQHTPQTFHKQFKGAAPPNTIDVLPPPPQAHTVQINTQPDQPDQFESQPNNSPCIPATGFGNNKDSQ